MRRLAPRLANPNLDPETIDTYELVWEQQLPANLRFSASAYYYRNQRFDIATGRC